MNGGGPPAFCGRGWRGWRRRWFLRRKPPPPALDEHIERVPILGGFAPFERKRLAALAWLWLHEKQLTPHQGLRLAREDRFHLALMAALPLLGLDLDWYAGYQEVILYPGRFRAPRRYFDGAGVSHPDGRVFSGEAWHYGPLVLAWEAVMAAGFGTGHNVVIHECAHQLDMRNGRANGFPPLPVGIGVKEWSGEWLSAWWAFHAAPHAWPGIDPYGAGAPAEFFSVLCELFFEAPERVIDAWPGLHTLFTRFFRQDPLARFNAGPWAP